VTILSDGFSLSVVRLRCRDRPRRTDGQSVTRRTAGRGVSAPRRDSASGAGRTNHSMAGWHGTSARPRTARLVFLVRRLSCRRPATGRALTPYIRDRAVRLRAGGFVYAPIRSPAVVPACATAPGGRGPARRWRRKEPMGGPTRARRSDGDARRVRDPARPAGLRSPVEIRPRRPRFGGLGAGGPTEFAPA